MKNIKLQINETRLQKKEPAIFLRRIENEILKPEIDNFLLLYSDLCSISNGERRKMLHKISIDFLKKIVINIIDIYNIC